MPGWRVVGAIWLVALSGCDLFDGSLLDRDGAPGSGLGRAGSGSNIGDGGDGTGGRASDAGAPPVSGTGSKPPVAGTAASNGGRGGSKSPDDDPDTDEEPDDDASVDEPPPPQDAGVADSAVSDAGPPVCTPAAGDYCTALPPLLVAPVIDGELDCGPAAVAMSPVGWNGSSALPAGHVTRIAAAWRPTGIYVYVEVVGSSTPHPAGADIYCGDAVELYIDHDGTTDASGNYADPGTRQFVVAAPSESSPGTIEALEFSEGNNYGAWETTELRTVRREDGYAVEAFITARDLDLTAWSPATRVGINVAVDVAAPSGTANLRCGLLRGQYFFKVGPTAGSGCNGEPWCDARAFCSPTLQIPSD